MESSEVNLQLANFKMRIYIFYADVEGIREDYEPFQGE